MAIDNGMITQTNFGFNHNKNLLTGEYEDDFDEEDEFNESIIQWNVDPVEWSKECKRVEKELMQFYASYDKQETTPINDCLTWAKEVQRQLTQELNTGFNTIIGSISKDLSTISKEESRLKSKNMDDVSKFELGSIQN